MNDALALTNQERAELEQLEEIIRVELEAFRRVGNALLRIKEGRLFREQYETFEQYCRDRWDISQSMGYYLMQASAVINNLEGGELESLPDRASYAAPLHILRRFENPDRVQQEAWAEALASTERVTGELVETIAQKHYVLNTGGFLAEAVNRNWAAPREAYRLLKVLERYPEYYIEAVYAFGVTERGMISGPSLQEIRSLEDAFPDEAKDILRSGFLDNGRDEIPLYELTKRDVDAYRRRLYFEQTEQRKMESGMKQRQQIQERSPQVVVADGFSIYELVERAAKEGKAMMYLFPEQAMTPQQLADLLEKQGCKILFVAAYTPDEPEFNFDGYPVMPSRINGVKPQILMDMIQSSVIG